MALLGRSKREKLAEPAEIQQTPLRKAVLEMLETLITTAAPESMKDPFGPRTLAKLLKATVGKISDYQLANGVRAMAKYSRELEKMIPSETLKLIDCDDASSRQA